MCERFNIVLGNKYFFMRISAAALNDDKFISMERDYINNYLEGYHTGGDKKSIIGLCGKHSASYNARVLSHEFIHCLLNQEVNYKTNLNFDNIAHAPLSYDCIGGSGISLSKKELHYRFEKLEYLFKE